MDLDALTPLEALGVLHTAFRRATTSTWPR